MIAAWGGAFSTTGNYNINMFINGVVKTNVNLFGDGTTRPFVVTTPLTVGDTVKWQISSANVTLIGDGDLRTWWEVIKLS
jgi:hypothetical protein